MTRRTDIHRTTEIVPFQEGDKCPDCGGVFGYKPVKNCSCHIHPPCSACVDNPLVCLNCGRRTMNPLLERQIIKCPECMNETRNEISLLSTLMLYQPHNKTGLIFESHKAYEQRLVRMIEIMADELSPHMGNISNDVVIEHAFNEAKKEEENG